MLKNDNDFLRQEITYGVILIGTLEQIQQFKQLIIQEDFKVVFQKTSLGKLVISEATDNDIKK